jgi:type IV pilus assembly protein PilV
MGNPVFFNFRERGVQPMNKKGFTLVEVLVGLVILAIGLLGIAGMQVSSVRGNFFSNNLTEATFIAKDRLEYLKNLPLEDSNGFLNPGAHADGSANISGVAFSRTYDVTQVNGLKTIAYNVTWNDGVAHRVSFTTIRSQ